MLIGIFIFLIQSKAGLIGRAFGMNYSLLQKRGYKPEVVRRIGLVLSNMLYAFSGILCVWAQKFADISMGVGISLIGIGAVIIGGQLFSLVWKRHSSAFNAKSEIFSCILGVIFYFSLMAFFLRMGVDPSSIKLFLGMILTFLFICNVRRIKI
jgi:putative ABC transport system permease protein